MHNATSTSTSATTRGRRPPMQRSQHSASTAPASVALADPKQAESTTSAAGSSLPFTAAASPSLQRSAPAPLAALPRHALFASDRSKQVEEIEVLRAIYSEEECSVLHEASSSSIVDSDARLPAVQIELGLGLQAVFTMPRDYPSSSPVECSLRFSLDWDQSGAASPSSVAAALNQLRDATFDPTTPAEEREVSIYQSVEWLKNRFIPAEEERRRRSVAAAEAAAARAQEEEALLEFLARELQLAEDEDNGSSARVSSFDDEDSSSSAPYNVAAAPTSTVGNTINIVSGPPLTDRRSTFQAHAALVSSPAEVASFREQLLAIPRLARATHNMFASALCDSGGIWRRECDDDGESGAGGRLAHLLHCMQAKNIAVVVSRWYGGVHLGSDRWKHINSTARAVVEQVMQEQQATATNSVASTQKKGGGKHVNKR